MVKVPKHIMFYGACVELVQNITAFLCLMTSLMAIEQAPSQYKHTFFYSPVYHFQVLFCQPFSSY